MGALQVLYIQPQRRSPTERYVFIDFFFFLQKFILLITPWQRASATGLVISGYGLSAFLFSTISHIFFADSASPLLLVLSLGSSFPMILGFFFVRPIPLPEEELNRDVCSETNSSGYEQLNSSYIPLLDPHINGQDDNDDTQMGVELSPTLRSQNCEISGRNLSRGAARTPDMLPNVHGKKLWCSGDFWLLCGIVSIRTLNYVSPAYLQSLFITLIKYPACSQRDRGDVYVFQLKEHSLC